MTTSFDYKAAGVDVEEGYRAVEMMKQHVSKTFTKNVLTGLGSFGALYEIGEKYENPVLVSGTDGVGTKLKMAFLTGVHNSVGIDLVAMCANDILCHGAKPLFFLDYFATGKLKAEVTADVVAGIAQGCLLAEASLVGGETAEMPGFYAEDEYDLAGFCVGIVDKAKIINGSSIKEGDVLLGLPSSGCHSNGYSLVRKVFFDHMDLRPSDYVEELGGRLQDELLKPTRIYVKSVRSLINQVEVKGLAHMTGGGFYENIPRMIPEGLGVEVSIGSWPILPVFSVIAREGNVSTKAMFNTFNMGIGMVIAVAPEAVEKTLEVLRSEGEEPHVIGKVVVGKGVTIFDENGQEVK